MQTITKKKISIPAYSLGEELVNAVTHGLGALLSAAALVLMLARARGVLAVTVTAIFGASMILLYTMSCVYHALPKGNGKKVLRVLDHCNVFLLVFGTYIPVALLGVSGVRGWVLFGLVAFFTLLGIVFTAVDLERFQLAAVLCQLLSGWSILLGISELRAAAGISGLLWMIAGGVMYTVGAALYGIGRHRKYYHSVFHVFCLLGTFCHFWAIYRYLL